MLVMIRDRPRSLTSSLRHREWAHREVIQDEGVGADQFADPFLPGAVRMTAGKVGEDAPADAVQALCPVAFLVPDYCLSKELWAFDRRQPHRRALRPRVP
ncbi:hypothetical protein [Streptomyces sp. NPDC002769]|uniref:hypothetical protein n=1 Tax=Streptomyces sp. NPDC002769 TaxID=3154542 RepID=UPI00332E1B0B